MDEKSYLKTVTKIGVIADIQYCDEDDGTSFDGSEIRRYREALNVTKRAAKTFENFQVGAVLQLGDAIDGKSKSNFKRDFCDRICPILEIPVVKANDDVGAFTPSVIPRMDVMGNHELYCATREKLSTILNDYDKDRNLLCYSKVIGNGRWRLIVLDSYGVSLLGHGSDERDSSRLKEAESIMKINNPNMLRKGEKVDWFEGLTRDKYRFVSYNGAIGKVQLDWLKQELKESWDEKQYVVIFSHVPMSNQKGNYPISLHWDLEEVQKLIKQNGSHVVACIGGHRHSFDYEYNDEFGTNCHHLDVPSPLVAPVGGEAHAIFEFSVRNLPVVKDELKNNLNTDNTSEIVETDLPLLNDSPTSQLDEKLVYYDGKLFKNETHVVCDKNNEVGMIIVHGFGEMPSLMVLPKEKPEW